MEEPTFVERAEAKGKRFIRQDRYVLVLFLIVATIVSTSFVGATPAGFVIPLAFASLTLLVSLSTSDAGRRTVTTARVVVAAGLTGVALAALLNLGGLARLGFFVVFLTLSIATPVVIARRLWKHPTVTIDTLAGAADIYLLIGLFFSVVYMLLGSVQAGGVDLTASAFSQTASAHSAFFIAGRPTVPSDFLYFSFATLTTVGYGDLTASTSLGRLLSNTEALLGQLYLVTVVAVLVGNMGRSRQQSTPPAEEAAASVSDGDGLGNDDHSE